MTWLSPSLSLTGLIMTTDDEIGAKVLAQFVFAVGDLVPPPSYDFSILPLNHFPLNLKAHHRPPHASKFELTGLKLDP